MREFVESQRVVSLTHDPSSNKPIHLVAADGEKLPKDDAAPDETSTMRELAWLELLRDGLVFDLRGLVPGKGADIPPVENRFDFESTPSSTAYETLHLVPGHHLAGGERSMPVVKSLIALARDLVHHFDHLEAIIWPPSMSVIGRQFFESTSTAWLEGGPFPALGLTAFKETIDGALQSVGLEFWLDQELRIEPPLSSEKVPATRLGVRLINQLILVGGVERDERIIAPDGTRLLMRTSRNGRFIRVSRE